MYYLDKKVYLMLKNKRVYSGIVIDVDRSNQLIFITIRDKDLRNVAICTDEINLIQEED